MKPSRGSRRRRPVSGRKLRVRKGRTPVGRISWESSWQSSRSPRAHGGVSRGSPVRHGRPTATLPAVPPAALRRGLSPTVVPLAAPPAVLAGTPARRPSPSPSPTTRATWTRPRPLWHHQRRELPMAPPRRGTAAALTPELPQERLLPLARRWTAAALPPELCLARTAHPSKVTLRAGQRPRRWQRSQPCRWPSPRLLPPPAVASAASVSSAARHQAADRASVSAALLQPLAPPALGRVRAPVRPRAQWRRRCERQGKRQSPEPDRRGRSGDTTPGARSAAGVQPGDRASRDSVD
mmetsp:Transcript_84060/g.261163  ORF Transcript_84060/g.261163 Transcript_84060/m.261163 type:complete len:295 (-) Transcript_84060:3-887(-)